MPRLPNGEESAIQFARTQKQLASHFGRSPKNWILEPDLNVRISPAHFAYYASGGKWVAAKHLKILTEYLCAIERGELKRLIVTMPPRHGKSELISRYFPAWLLLLHPELRVILTSYEATFAADWGRKVQDLVREYGPLFGTSLNENKTAVAGWETSAGGGMISVGAGGALTGRGTDCLIVDDPIKNADEARSAHARNTLWEWFTTTAFSRLEPGAACIVLHTRWHEDDLIGRLLEQEQNGEEFQKENWVVLNLPAIAEDDDIIGRKPGEALWPARFPVAELEKLKFKQGAQYWSALYQQHPAPLAGTIFKNDTFKYFSFADNGFYRIGESYIDPASTTKFQVVDLAASIKASADYFVVQTWAKTKNNDLLLLDNVRTKVEGPDQLALLQTLYNQHHPAYIGIEAVSFQITALQAAIRAGLPVRKLTPDKDKVSRAISAAVRYEAGTIYHLANASWLTDFESELLSFPNAKNDDQVDCVAYAALQTIGGNLVFGSVSTRRERYA